MPTADADRVAGPDTAARRRADLAEASRLVEEAERLLAEAGGADPRSGAARQAEVDRRLDRATELLRPYRPPATA
jgi:hypothetical protein